MSQPNLAEELEPTVDQAASQPAPAPRAEIPTQKQKTNIYTMMLIISFICIVVACILLFWEVTLWGDYPWWRTDESRPNLF